MPNYLKPAGTYGKVTLVATTATKIPATPLNGRNGIIIFNRGTADMFIGFNALVTDLNGIPIPPGGSIALEAAYNANIATPTLDVYGYSVAGQVAPNDTRYMEVL